MNPYFVYDGESVVGEITLRPEGAFLVVYCRCRPKSGKPERVDLILEKNRCIELGFCIPNGKEMTLVKRIRKKDWHPDARFEIRNTIAATKDNADNAASFDEIENLPFLRLEKQGEEWSFSQAPGQPDNDPSP